jgi:hypothetical protein
MSPPGHFADMPSGRDDVRSWQILLQKSAVADGLSAILLRTASIDPPARTWARISCCSSEGRFDPIKALV